MKKLLKQIKKIEKEIQELKNDWKNGSCDMIDNEYYNYLAELNDQLEELEKLTN